MISDLNGGSGVVCNVLYSLFHDQKKPVVIAILKAYLQALSSGDYDTIMRLFSPTAIVHSPLYGERPAADFYWELIEDTQRSDITPLDYFENEARRGAVNFLYRWTMENGTTVEFDCVDIVEFADDDLITKIKIIYDTDHTRKHFDQLKQV